MIQNDSQRYFVISTLLIFILALVVILTYNVSSQCFGFSKDGVCYNIGDELRIDGVYYYIDANGDSQEQKSDGSSCQNDFECLNNLCSNGVCVDLYKEAEKQGELVEDVLNKSEEIRFGYNAKISIATIEDTYEIGEKIELTNG
tara:strand:- start:2436 stop:2867 length:432 start_codon:yes stop_codon:yes gene_type:complete